MNSYLGQLAEDVMTTIEEAKNKIADMPKAKNDLGPLLEALGRECSLHFFQALGLTMIYRAFVPNRSWSGLALGWCVEPLG